MFGMICCGPAGQFAFDEQATEQQRLERPAGDTGGIASLPQSLADWPTYRADNARSARTQAAVAERVGLLWEFAGGGSEPTAPVAAGGLVFYGGLDGIVRGLDADSGKVRWTAYTGGAVRYPPTIADGRALVGSGDGWVYALEAATGRLLWRFRAAPAERRIPVYGALLSTWPVAGGVLVDQGTAYFAAGINDFDGTHLYALDAASGKIRWQNHSAGHLDAASKRGVACQGEMLLHAGRLYLAGGNAVSPGIFELADGRCLNAPPTSMGTTATRGRELQLVDNRVAVVGQPLYSRPEAPVFDKSVQWDNPVVTAQNAELACLNRPDANGPAWRLAARKPQGGGEMWTVPLPAMPVRWAAAVDSRGRIAVALRNGHVLCFGEK
jgi:outer membrane protein assembly factor BamB